MNRIEEEDLLTRYYMRQIGGGFDLYRGAIYQKGKKIVKSKKKLEKKIYCFAINFFLDFFLLSNIVSLVSHVS